MTDFRNSFGNVIARVEGVTEYDIFGKWLYTDNSFDETIFLIESLTN